MARTGEAITKVEMTRRRCTVDTAPPQHVSSLNAFDLITLSSALNFDNLFVYTVTVEAAANDGSAHRALPTLALPAMRHTSRAPPEELLSRVASATMQLSRCAPGGAAQPRGECHHAAWTVGEMMQQGCWEAFCGTASASAGFGMGLFRAKSPGFSPAKAVLLPS